jgi:lipid-binding SYLF domain-containing protein
MSLESIRARALNHLRARPRLLTVLFLALLSVAACARPPESSASAREADRERVVAQIADAAAVLSAMPEIPVERRRSARCVAVVPSLVRGGFLIAGRHGEGVVSCRTPSGWSAPAFIGVSGGGAGVQIGIEASDVVMLVMSDRAMTQFFRSNFALGADASASAGPAGQARQAATDPDMKAEVLSYARSRGLYAGAELSGAVVRQDTGALAAMYGPSQTVNAILAGDVPAPREALALLDRLHANFDVAGGGAGHE